MGGRRLVLSSYSDEEDKDEQQQLHQSATGDNDQNNHQPIPEANLDDAPITIPSSPEDDYIDVPEVFSSHSNVSSAIPQTNYDSCPVDELLFSKGLKLRREWIITCLTGINPSRNVHELARICFEMFLVSNMNTSGAGILPPSVHSMHLVDLSGCPLKNRYRETPAGVKRCLKLSMTDGVQRVFGIEYRPIKDLGVFSSAGSKIVLCNVHIRRGLLLLVPEAVILLGGIVEELDLARQRLVNEVNKPPRGRSRTGDSLPLSTRATNAAWNSNSGVGFAEETRLSEANNIARATNPSSISSNHINGNGMNSQMNRNHVETEDIEILEIRETNPSINISNELEVLESMEANPPVSISSRINTEGLQTIIRSKLYQIPDKEEAETLEILDEKLPNHVIILDDTEEKNPFQYLADLSTKWAEVIESSPSIQGKIKCFLTGVKGFQYKNRQTYDLRVFVDDGSLISEILIDHKLVQERINHTPEEATLALSSSDASKARDMKEKLKSFQSFLINFEGVMVIEMNHQSPVPIALTMEQGCPSSYLSLLLKRFSISIAR